MNDSVEHHGKNSPSGMGWSPECSSTEPLQSPKAFTLLTELPPSQTHTPNALTRLNRCTLCMPHRHVSIETYCPRPADQALRQAIQFVGWRAVDIEQWTSNNSAIF